MIVLSLFDGMSTGQTALRNLGVEIDTYYASEIKPHAIELTKHHYPDTVHLGDVTKWREWDIEWDKIDLILSGSPCQDLSIAGKRAGITGERSSLFFTFVEILNKVKELNPDVLFLQENVASATQEDVGIMSRALGVYPVRINSKLLTAQLRDRYYWTNARTKPYGMFGDLVTDIPQPEDKNILFKDIITDGATDRDKAVSLLESESRPLNKDSQDKLKKRYSKAFTNLVSIADQEVRIKTNTKKGYDVLTENDCLNLAYPKSKTRRGRVVKNKAPALMESNNELYTLEDLKVRVLNQTELERLQGFPDGWTSILSRNKAASLLGDGWTLPVIEHIFSYFNFDKTKRVSA